MITHDLFLYVGIALMIIGWAGVIAAIRTDLKESIKFTSVIVIILIASIICLWTYHPAIEIS